MTIAFSPCYRRNGNHRITAAGNAFVAGLERVVAHRLGAWAPAAPIALAVLGWSDVVSLTASAGREGRPTERHLVNELATYLRGVADMRDTKSNEVHVVALTRRVWEGWPADLSPVDEVEKHRLYHYPTVGNYRKIVPNYMAFRYDGRLQSIHHAAKCSWPAWQ